MKYTITRTDVGYAPGVLLNIYFTIEPDPAPPLRAPNSRWMSGCYAIEPNGEVDFDHGFWPSEPEEMTEEDRELMDAVERYACTELAHLLLTYGTITLVCTGRGCPAVLLPLAALRGSNLQI